MANPGHRGVQANSQCSQCVFVQCTPSEPDKAPTDKQKGNVMTQTSALFNLGRVLATPGAVEALERSGQSLWHYLSRHLAGDWGSVDAEDKAANDEALKDGSRLLSAYVLDAGSEVATKIWLITEAADDHGDRSATTALLPEEY